MEDDLNNFVINMDIDCDTTKTERFFGFRQGFNTEIYDNDKQQWKVVIKEILGNLSLAAVLNKRYPVIIDPNKKDIK